MKLKSVNNVSSGDAVNLVVLNKSFAMLKNTFSSIHICLSVSAFLPLSGSLSLSIHLPFSLSYISIFRIYDAQLYSASPMYVGIHAPRNLSLFKGTACIFYNS